MTVRVTPEMRERIDAKKIDMKKENYIYESSDNGKTIYRREIYDDVSGVQLELPFKELQKEDENALSLLAKRVLELEEVIDKIKALVR
tara:strand:- start:251 stop:514 length:264 start_codon:yes stop_codon:yes gene_type:complete